jgi:RNA polymerase sigma-70 factor (ECF subfamily)
MPQGPSYRNHDEILQGIRRRDTAAFDALFDRYADRLYGFSLKLSGTDKAAREILQRVFIDALPHLKDARTEQAVERILLREASHQIQTLRGGNGNDPPAGEIPYEELFPDKAGGKGGSAHDWSMDPGEEARRPEEKRLLREIIAGLPPRYGLVLVLRDMEEMTGQDVAEILNISFPSVKTRLHRARLLLRRELTERLLEGVAPEPRESS